MCVKGGQRVGSHSAIVVSWVMWSVPWYARSPDCCCDRCASVPQEYFTAILKKLKAVGASSKQSNFYV